MKRYTAKHGFTLIELLVVLAIILIVTTSSLGVLSRIFRDQPVKAGGRLVKMAFGKINQLAITQRHTHFLVFDVENSALIIYKKNIVTDKDRYDLNKIYEPNEDTEQVDEAIPLPEGVEFETENVPPGSLFTMYEPVYLAFGSDGSIKLPENVYDKPLNLDNDTHQPSSADIILKHKRHSGRMFLDFASYTAKIAKMVYWDGEVSW